MHWLSLRWNARWFPLHMQVVDPGTADAAAGHLKQASAPAFELNVFSLQSRQSVRFALPRSCWNLPGGQVSSTVVPAGQ